MISTVMLMLSLYLPLNFGNAKAFVATMKGTRNPLTSIVK